MQTDEKAPDVLLCGGPLDGCRTHFGDPRLTDPDCPVSGGMRTLLPIHSRPVDGYKIITLMYWSDCVSRADDPTIRYWFLRQFMTWPHERN